MIKHIVTGLKYLNSKLTHSYFSWPPLGPFLFSEVACLGNEHSFAVYEELSY